MKSALRGPTLQDDPEEGGAPCRKRGRNLFLRHDSDSSVLLSELDR